MEKSGSGKQKACVKVDLNENGEIMYILLEQCFGNEYGVSGRGYSIVIESEIEGVFEREILEDVCRDYEEAFELLRLFAENTVTPDSALYVMEDILS